MNLPLDGRYSLTGPPGSGKTNLLLLRAQFLAGSGEKNVLIITYSNALCNFIRSGIGKSGFISNDQVKTFHSWAGSHIVDQLGFGAISLAGKFDDTTRAEILEKLKEANTKLPSSKIYSGIFVDEAQDLSVEELELLLSLSDKVCISGDLRQGIYQKDGLSIAQKLNLTQFQLTSHFRIGQRIAQVADKLMPPDAGEPSLESIANYNPKIQGESTAKMNVLESRAAQFEKMIELIRIQLDAFNDDSIGVFAGTNDTIAELKRRFDATDLAGLVAYHGYEDSSFSPSKRIHLITLHSAKGTEFRAVHIFGAEELRSVHLRRTRLAYTAITRARTALNVFCTGETTRALDSAFAQTAYIDLDDLFEEKT